MTYRAGRDQRQYLILVAGGYGTLDTVRGDFVIAFALPAVKLESPPDVEIAGAAQ
jgi:glucose dehydrogenase